MCIFFEKGRRGEGVAYLADYWALKLLDHLLRMIEERWPNLSVTGQHRSDTREVDHNDPEGRNTEGYGEH